MAMGFGWPQLPDDLLRAIARRLKCVEDMLAFAHVCSSWRAVYVNLKSVWTPTLPWLVMAENNDDNPLCIRTVVDPNNNKRYQMKLPETFGRHCWGCEDGWIFTLGLDLETHLFNPLTKARLSLPSALTLPLEDYDINYYDPQHWELLRREYIQKVNVISVPPNGEILVMVIYHKNDLAVAEPGDSEWSSLNGRRHPERHYVQGVFHYADSIVGVYEDGSVHFINADFFLHLDNPCLGGLFRPKRDYIFSDVEYSYVYLGYYLGNILVVLRYVSDMDMENDELLSELDPSIGSLTWLFEVFVFDFDERDWFQLSDLGDEAIFVGNSSAECVYATEGSNCKPNCIYFTDERPFFTNLIGHDTGIYDIKDHSFERVYHGVDFLSKFCPPFWFMPKLV